MPARPHDLAKLSRPRLPPVATRDRLFRRLDALHDQPCRWICGPSGSGKTTLVADYLRSREDTCFWFHVDEGDHDPSATIAHLVALACSVDRDATSLPYFTPEHAADPDGFHRYFFRRFFAVLPPSCVVVFDNCHRASGTAFPGLLRIAIEEAPTGIRLFAASRHQLPDELLTARANRQVEVIGAEELQLDLGESRAVMAAMQRHPDTDIEMLHAMCGGWAAGLVLMLSRVSGGETIEHAPRPDRFSNETVFAYFANELLRSAAPALRDLLVRTSLLPAVTAEFAQTLTGNPAAGELLDGLYRRHFFTVRRENGFDTDVGSYAYHDLFRAFLLDRLERDLEPGDLRALRAQVASMLEGAGMVPEAIEQYRLIERWDDAVRLIHVEAPRLIDQGRFRTLGDRLGGLPAGRVTDDPWLLFYRGHVITSANSIESEAIFEAAYAKFVAVGDEAGQFAAAFAVMETIVLNHPSYKPWDRWIDVVVRLLESRPPTEPCASVRAWHTLLYTCLYRRPGHRLIATAVAVLDRELFSGRLRPAESIQAATGLLAYAHFACDEGLAARVIPVLERWLEEEQGATMSRALGVGWLTVYYYFGARYALAEQWSAAASELAAKQGFGVVAGIQAWYRVQSLAQLGRRDEAFAEAARLRSAEHAFGSLAPPSYAATCEALVHFVAGDLPTAIAIGERGVAAWRENGFIAAGLAWAQSMLAIYRMTAGETDIALALVADAKAGLSGTVCIYADALHELLLAQGALVRHERDRAIEHLKACLAMAGNHKRIALLSWARPFLPTLFALAWEEGIERDAVSALIAEWRIPSPSPTELHWPRTLEIDLLGNFEVRRRGVPIDFGRKPPRKVLALLKAIAISGERGLSIETACQYLWPDQDGDAAVASRTAALYRLRKLVGYPEAIRLADGRLTLDPATCRVDIAVFERLAQGTADRDRRGALELYRGPLLPHDEDEPWCAAARLRLRDVFSRLVERVAAPLETTDPDAAEHLYRRGIDAEPLAEASYRGLMRCHVRQGRTADAAAVYRRLRQTLSVVLGIEPSDESERLRRSILDGA